MPPVPFYADTTQTIWVNWASNTTVTDTTGGAWLAWNQGQTSGTTSQVIWMSWTDGTGYVSAYEPVVLSEEERERRRVEAAERQRVQNEAKARARTLLLEVLDERQRTELQSDGHFHVHTRDGVRTYRLRPGSAPQLVKSEDGRRWSYCIHPREPFPADDTTAALKLMLETDEERFLETANASYLGAEIAVAT